MSNPILKYFECGHLPPTLQEVSAPLCAMAKVMQDTLPDCAEKSAGLRKLLEAKDCFVRAALEEKPAEKTTPKELRPAIRYSGDYCGNDDGPCHRLMPFPDNAECCEGAMGCKLQRDAVGYLRTQKCKHYLGVDISGEVAL